MRDCLPLIGAVPAGDDDCLDQLFAGYLACYQASWTTFPDVDSALAALAETTLELAILTNGSAQQQNAKLDAVGLRARVGNVFTAEELGVAKPDPSTYINVCRRLGIDPGGVLHVGDVYDLDVLAPRRDRLINCESRSHIDHKRQLISLAREAVAATGRGQSVSWRGSSAPSTASCCSAASISSSAAWISGFSLTG